jgi:hypothetical protein
MLSRDVWMRIGYSALGGGSAYLWNKFSPIETKGLPFVPPAVLLGVVIYNEDFGETEKDLAASALGFMCAAQAISFAKSMSAKPPENLSGDITPISNPTPSDTDKLQKIRAVTGTLGALTSLISEFRGSSR